MAQSVVPSKDKKVQKVFEALGDGISEDSFKAKFKELFPKDWENIQRVYAKEERNTKPGKSHPMPEPEKYLSNMFKVFLKKFYIDDMKL